VRGKRQRSIDSGDVGADVSVFAALLDERNERAASRLNSSTLGGQCNLRTLAKPQQACAEARSERSEK
jgi:hypothetical protein